jgi:ribosomal protein S10
MDRSRRVEQHTWVGNSPDAWRSCASDLLAAAAVLRERRESISPGTVPLPNVWRLHPVELMLDGMAIECLLKALWVKRGHKLAKDGAYVRVPQAGPHDLVQLAGVLQLPLSHLEKDVLRRLSHFIEYRGRYPVPKDAEKLQLTRTPRGGRSSATHWNTPSDQRLFDAVVSRLDRLLDEGCA